MAVEATVPELLYQQSQRLGELEGQLSQLVTRGDFEARMSSLEATLNTNRWWMVWTVGFLSVVVAAVGIAVTVVLRKAQVVQIPKAASAVAEEIVESTITGSCREITRPSVPQYERQRA